MSPDEKLRDDMIYQNFHSPGHHGLEDLRVQLIDRVDNEKDLLDKKDNGHIDLNV